MMTPQRKSDPQLANDGHAANRPDASDAIRLPPGPKGAWLPTLRLIREPRAALEGWAKSYGDPFLLHAINGPVVVTGRSDLIREIHGQDPSMYAVFATATVEPLLGAGSMLAMDGEPHRRERRLTMPMFHGERMKAYGQTMQSIAVEQVEVRLSRGTSVETLELMTDVSLEVIVRTVFGGDDRGLVTQLMDASRRLVAGSSPLLFFSRRSHFPMFGLGPWDRWQSAKRRLFELLDRVVESRRGAPEGHDDILSMLLAATYEDGSPITREHLYAELVTFLFAGHETTALSLTWAVYHLHRTQALAKLRQELDSLPDGSPAFLAAAPYLKASIQETLRVHPIVTETLRKLKVPMRLGDYMLPAGYAVAPATVLAHYNPETYPAPDEFRPERFIERSYGPFEYMPFGGGHRRCIGAAFATYEMAMVLGVLLRRYDIQLVDSRPVVPKRRNVTMGPSTPVPIRIQHRT